MTDPKITIDNLIKELPTIAGVICAAILALNGVAGWPWFLIVAVLI